MTTPSPPRPADHRYPVDDVDVARSGSSPTDTAATIGTVAGLVGAVPVIGPALVAGCLSCAGIGAAAGTGSTAALPPGWWVGGLAVTALASGALEARNARQCKRAARPMATIATLIVVAAAAWLATRYAIRPTIDRLIGAGAAPPRDGPTLP